MKNHILLLLSTVGLSSMPVKAASYISDFSSLGVSDPLDGVDGWTQNYPNYVDPDDSTYISPWAYGTQILTSGGPVAAAAVGGYYSTFAPLTNADPPAPDSFYTSHTLSLEKGMLFEMSFAINDSTGFNLLGDPTTYGTQRNIFRISFYDAAYEVFSLVFTPNDNPNSVIDTTDSWNVSSSSGGVQTASVMAVFEDQLYNLNLSLLPNAGNLNYFYSINSSNTAIGEGVLTGLTGQIDSLRVGIDPDSVDSEFGTNQLLFNSIVATVPEPSTTLLFATAAIGFAFRRRRP